MIFDNSIRKVAKVAEPRSILHTQPAMYTVRTNCGEEMKQGLQKMDQGTRYLSLGTILSSKKVKKRENHKASGRRAKPTQGIGPATNVKGLVPKRGQTETSTKGTGNRTRGMAKGRFG